MTEATGRARSAAEGAAGTAKGATQGATGAVGLGQGVDRLKEEAQKFAGAQAQRMLTSLGEKLGDMTTRLESGGSGGMLVEGGKQLAQGKSPGRAAASAGAKGIKEKVKGVFQKLTGGGRAGSPKVINILEDIDVGVPVRVAYDQWTQYQEFNTFTKGVQSVETTDELTTNWKAKIFWSNRSWKGSVTEQIPDERIVWSSEGEKGTVNGVVTFHPLGDNLTKVLLVIEYYPKGFFEKTGNLWRAQGRRVRLDLKHYRRFVMMRAEATGSWRGEIRDGEVVRGHEEAVEAEEEAPEAPEAEEEEEAPEEEAGEEYAEEDEYAEDEEEPPEGAEYEDEYEEEEEPAARR